MGYILGIDAGGTYTDSVLVDNTTKKIKRKSKALTTKENLAIGIRNSINNLMESESLPVKLVSLSTTLATNAVVENKGHRSGLILIGKPLSEHCPADIIEVIPGLFDMNGKELVPLDEALCKDALKKMEGNVDAIAISGFAGTRNPMHELKVREIIKETLDIPIVCAHELSDGLGFYERSVTAVLNAKLIPIIRNLIEAVKFVLDELNIDAPLMVVKGDGSITEASKATFRPIETIMSGPAAGIVGGRFLSNMENAIIFDMGGTTCDVASIENGHVCVTKEGAIIGGYSTKVKAAQVFTFGAGGDSRITYRRDNGLQIDIQRVVPICTIGARYPNLEKELKITESKPPTEFRLFGSWDCFIYRKDSVQSPAPLEIELLDTLKEAPHSIGYLYEHFKTPLLEHSLNNLLKCGAIEIVSFTPTDLLYIQGAYETAPTKAPELCAKIISKAMGMKPEDFKEKIKMLFTEKLASICLHSMGGFEGNYDKLDTEVARYFLKKGFNHEASSYFNVKLSVGKPIVALGAPAQKWVSTIKNLIDCQIIIPENFEVACAVGAAVGQVKEIINILIRPSGDGHGFNVFAPDGCFYFANRNEAITYGLNSGREHIKNALASDKTYEYKIIESHEDIYSEAVGTTGTLYMETRISVSAIGQPPWEN